MGRLFSHLGLKDKANDEKNEETGNPTFYKGNKTVNILRLVGCVLANLLSALAIIYTVKCYFDSNTNIGLHPTVLIMIYGHVFGSGIAFSKWHSHIPLQFHLTPTWFNKDTFCYLSICLCYIFLMCWCFKTAPYVLLIGPILIFLQFFAIALPGMHMLFDYSPYDEKKEKTYKLVNVYEERTTKEKYLSVKESGPFRIVVENVGEKDIEKFDLRREEQVFEGSQYRHKCFKMRVVLVEPLKKGQSVVIIPETHNEEGAIKALGYRSFGPNKAYSISTIAAIPHVLDKSSSLIQEFDWPRKIGGRRQNTFIEQRECH